MDTNLLTNDLCVINIVTDNKTDNRWRYWREILRSFIVKEKSFERFDHNNVDIYGYLQLHFPTLHK